MSEDQLLCKVAALEATVEELRKENSELNITLEETRKVLSDVVKRLNAIAEAQKLSWIL